MVFNVNNFQDTTPNIITSLDLKKLNLTGDLTTSSDIIVESGNVEINEGKFYLKNNAKLNSVITCINESTGECDYLELPTAQYGITNAVQQALNLKQNIINTDSKLSGNLVIYDTQNSVNSKIGILQTTSDTHTANIDTINTTLSQKQNTITSTNKITSDNVTYNDGVLTTVSAKLGTLSTAMTNANTAINSKLNLSGGTLTGNLNIGSSNDLIISKNAVQGKLLYCNDNNGVVNWINDNLKISNTNLQGFSKIDAYSNSSVNYGNISNTSFTLDMTKGNIIHATPSSTSNLTLSLTNFSNPTVASSFIIPVTVYLDVRYNPTKTTVIVIGGISYTILFKDAINTVSTGNILLKQQIDILYVNSTTPKLIISSLEVYK